MLVFLTFSLFLHGGVFGALTGTNDISTHYYEDQAVKLESHPTFCEYKGSQMALSRVTAVQGLAKSECGACLEIKSGDPESKSAPVYAVAVDLGGSGLDLNKSQFQQLFKQVTGRFSASWKTTSDSNCVGVLKGVSSNTQQSGSTNTQQPEPNNTQQPDQYDPNSQQLGQNSLQYNPQQLGQSLQQFNTQQSPMEQSQSGQNTQQPTMDQYQPGTSQLSNPYFQIQ